MKRRLSAGKVVGSGVILSLGVAGYFLSTFAGMSKPVKDFFFANPANDVPPSAKKTAVKAGCCHG